MKVLQLGRYYPPHVGGIETVLFEITEGLNAKGLQCDVLCSNQSNALEISLTNGYKIIRAPSYAQILSTSISPSLIFQLRRIIQQYDVIHLHHPDPMATVALLLSRPSQKIVVHWHSDIIRQKLALFFYRPIQEKLLRRSDRIIVTSKNYLDTSQHLLHFKEKAVVIPIGINAGMVANKEKLAELKARFANKTVVFGLGRHVYYKGFEYLIDSAGYLDDSFVIIIGGDGPLTPSLIKRVEEKGLGSKVVFTGRISESEIHSYFELCDIFCLSSIERTEAFGVVLLEAMSLGKPLVATNIPGSGANWINQHNHTGLNVEPKDAQALAQAFLSIISNEVLRKSFAQKSKERYYEKFTRDAMVTQIISMYSSM